jgi:hypothetical protein
MRILIAIALIIVFISALFILITGDAMFRAAFQCTDSGEKPVCVYRGLDNVSAFGIFIIAFFIMIDILSVYLVLTNVE